MNFFKRFALGILCSLFASSCADTGFTKDELALIGSEKDGIMRLYTVENCQDDMLLRRKAKELDINTIKSKAFKTLCDRMLATVCDTTNQGVGIAAPQVGLSCRLIAVQRLDKQGQPFEFYVNPIITCFSEEIQTGKEGCLSVPGRSGKVDRVSKIDIKYINPTTLDVKHETIDGFTAVIFQHEIDHLDGVLYIDKLNHMEEELRTIDYTPQGVCSKRIEIMLEGDIVKDIVFTKGCNGNTQGVAALAKGRKIDDVINALQGIKCGGKDTSCPDQLAIALKSK